MNTRNLLAGVAVVAALAGCRGWETTEPPVHINPNMDTQEKGKAYRKSAFFPDGRYMRPAIEGTVARGFLKVDPLKNDGLDAAGAPATDFPGGPEVWTASLETGRIKYGTYCAPCHGHALDGLGGVNTKLTVKAPSLMDARIKELAVGKIYQAMKNGVNNGNMGSYAAQLSEDERWSVAYYVRDMQRQKDPTVTWGGTNVVIEAVTVASVEHGAKLYKARACNACHSVDGTPAVGPSFKGLFGKSENTDKGAVTVDAAYLKESMLDPNAKIVVGFPPAMPPQVGLSDIDLDSLVMFIEGQK
jgi:mono/diheme cytochrome c family protein